MSTIYLIPSVLAETATETIPNYILTAINDCQVIFAENERTTRRFLKSLNKDIVIDNFEWYAIHKAEEEQLENFRKIVAENKNIAIISEAGCPGIADPGQKLIAVAQQMGCKIKPLVGPSSILLALMASGLNGQKFEFIGYLPVEVPAREKMIRELEQSSAKNDSTKIFIETPYRNNQLLESIVKICAGSTKLCIATDLTATNETVITKPVSEWKNSKPDIHKKPTIFLIYSGR